MGFNSGFKGLTFQSLGVNLYYLCRFRNKTLINSLYFGFTHNTHKQLLYLLTCYFRISPYNVHRLYSINLIFMDPCIVVWLSRNTNKMQLCNRIYYSKVYWRLNKFRAAHLSTSGALNSICSLWCIYPYGDWPLSRLSGKKSHTASTTAGHHMCI